MVLNEKKTLLLFTLCFSIITLFLFYPKESGKRFTINTSHYPTLGDPNASVHLIVFEEFTCFQCSRFHLEDLPQIIEQYVKTNQVKYTSIPSAYLDSSLTPFRVALAILNQEQNYYWEFLDFYFSNLTHKKSSLELLGYFSKVHKCFDYEKARIFLTGEPPNNELLEIRSAIDKIYKSDISMPTILINGKLLKKVSLKTICAQIDKELENV